jgi:hypothetical protein
MSLNSTPLHSHSVKAGSCPHGLPLGACPICNGMAGGNSTTKRDVPRNVGEMSYNQCLAIGAMLKAQKQARAQAKEAQQNYVQSMINFSKSVAQLHQKILDISSIISKSAPNFISKPMNFILTNIIGRVLNLVQNLPTAIVSFSQKFVDISDKLVAVFGEIKASIKEKVSKFISNVKKKLKSIFSVFCTSEVDDEECKIEEAKRTFELKTFIQSLVKNFKKEKDIEKDEY